MNGCLFLALFLRIILKKKSFVCYVIVKTKENVKPTVFVLHDGGVNDFVVFSYFTVVSQR